MSNEIAGTILSQLGGNRFACMTGAKNFIALENGLQFSLPRAANGINKVRVILTPADTYNVQFLKFSPSKGTVKEICGADGVYCDQLQSFFTDATGLYTSL